MRFAGEFEPGPGTAAERVDGRRVFEPVDAVIGVEVVEVLEIGSVIVGLVVVVIVESAATRFVRTQRTGFAAKQTGVAALVAA